MFFEQPLKTIATTKLKKNRKNNINFQLIVLSSQLKPTNPVYVGLVPPKTLKIVSPLCIEEL